MNKKGFTLIELLAVILILGIIALIAIPTVNNILKESRVGAWKSTASQMVKGAESYYSLSGIKNKKYINDFVAGTLSDGTILTEATDPKKSDLMPTGKELKELELKGLKPKSKIEPIETEYYNHEVSDYIPDPTVGEH